MLPENRYKQLMKDVGLPNSRSLLVALQQCAHESAYHQRKILSISKSQITNREDRNRIIEHFLSSELGKTKGDYHYENWNGRIGDLGELLDRFQKIIEAGELVESRNPKTKLFTLIDRSKGLIISNYKKSFLKSFDNHEKKSKKTIIKSDEKTKELTLKESLSSVSDAHKLTKNDIVERLQKTAEQAGQRNLRINGNLLDQQIIMWLIEQGLEVKEAYSDNHGSHIKISW